MGDTIAIDNKALTRMQRLLLNYYNTFMVEMNDPVTNEPYVFREMRNIGANKQGGVPTDNVPTEASYNIDLFNQFINAIVNFQLSNNVNNFDNLLKIRKSNATQEINLGTVKHIFSCMNVINVFVDILEAYKYFIDNDKDFKSKLYKITKIEIVDINSKTTAIANADSYANRNENIGYHIDTVTYEKSLYLSIKSFTNSSDKVNNNIFDYIGTKAVTSYPVANSATDGTHGLFKTDNTMIQISNANIDYLRQTVENETDPLTQTKIVKINGTTHNYKSASELFTLENRDRALLKNFLYFLINMHTDNVRMQVNALYYYYKFIQLYTLLVLTTLNVIINDLSVTGFKVLKLSTVTTTYTLQASGADIFKHVYDTGKTVTDFTHNIDGAINTLANVPKVYAATIASIQQQIDKLVNDLYNIAYKNDNTDYTSNLENIVNTTISSLSAIKNTDADIKLYFTSYVDTYNEKLSDTKVIEILKKNYNIVHNGKYYDIIDGKYPAKAANAAPPATDAGTAYFLIKARFPIPVRTDLENVPVFIPSNFVASTHETTPTTIYGNQSIKIVKKGLLALKGDYNSGKRELIDINGNIRMNTSKINNQKNLYSYQESKHNLLTNQLYAYYAVLGAILIGVIAINVMNVEKPMKQMASMIFAGLVVILFIVYYIINASYMEDFRNVEKFFVLTKADQLVPGTTANPNYLRDKRDFLSATIDGLNLRFIEFFQKVIATLPATEAVDFYVELNNVMKNEKQDKTDINEILAFKKSLGYSNIDMLKYEVNNLKIYIMVLLVSALIATCLYTAHLYLPDEYSNLLMFVALILFIIIFAYYMIFTTKTVRNRSSNKYWGPEINSRL